MDFKECVLIDFGGILKDDFAHEMLHYKDLSPKGDLLEAINMLYDVLRWSELRSDAKFVLIADISHLLEDKGEHFEALFDRIFRATSGRNVVEIK